MLRAYECIPYADSDLKTFEMFISSLYSALDISAELFGRYTRFRNSQSISKDPFNPREAEIESRNIRRDWQTKNRYPKDIEELRTYRNLMVHGHLFGVIQNPVSGYYTYPRPGSIKNYLDWRSVKSANESHNVSDFLSGNRIAELSFDIIISYLEKQWQACLLGRKKADHNGA